MVSLEWDCPASDGGSAILAYAVESRASNQDEYTLSGVVHIPKVTTYDVTELTEGQTYQFRVRAQNEAGLSEEYAELQPIKTQLPYSESRVQIQLMRLVELTSLLS